MATAMATTTTETVLEERMRELRGKIHTEEQGLDAIRHDVSAVESLVAELRSDRMAACLAVAQGKRDDPERYDRRITQAKDRLDGLEQLRSRKELQIVDLKVALRDLDQQVAQIARQKALRDENERTHKLISNVETAIEQRGQLQRIITSGISTLRSTPYLAEGARRTAMDAAFRLERIAAGMRA